MRKRTSETHVLGTSPGNGRLHIAAQGHRPQILDAKIFRRKVEKREEERETEVKGRKEERVLALRRYLSLTFCRNTSTSTGSNHRNKISKSCVLVTFTTFRNIGFRKYKLYSSLRTTISVASDSQLLLQTSFCTAIGKFMYGQMLRSTEYQYKIVLIGKFKTYC